MKGIFSSLKFWKIFFVIYLCFYCIFILIFNPDLLDWKNSLFLIPLCISVFAYSNLQSESDKEDCDGHWSIKLSLLAVIVLITVFKILADSIRWYRFITRFGYQQPKQLHHYGRHLSARCRPIWFYRN